MSIDEPRIELEEGEFLVLPRKCFKRMIEPVLQLGVVEDTGQRLRLDFQSTQVWRLKNEPCRQANVFAAMHCDSVLDPVVGHTCRTTD
jgi:hypothetical protein